MICYYYDVVCFLLTTKKFAGNILPQFKMCWDRMQTYRESPIITFLPVGGSRRYPRMKTSIFIHNLKLYLEVSGPPLFIWHFFFAIMHHPFVTNIHPMLGNNKTFSNPFFFPAFTKLSHNSYLRFQNRTKQTKKKKTQAFQL